MPAISQVIPNLLGGVSQQPDPVKLPGQCRELINAHLDPTFGCRKRPPTKFIAKLASDIPEDAKWFPIFRDDVERYVVAIYKPIGGGNTTIRVWDAKSGAEQTVEIDPSANSYLDIENVRNFNELTINDYTLLTNSEKVVTMSSDVTEEPEAEALVVVNQVAYNASYNIDFLKPGEAPEKEKVYKATKISVNPGSFEDLDETGGCSFADQQAFSEDSGEKTDLGFRLTTNCTPTLITDEVPGVSFPTGVTASIPQPQKYFTGLHGSADGYPVGQFLRRNVTTINGNLTVAVECRVSTKFVGGGNRYDFTDAAIVNYDQNKPVPWKVGDGGQHSSGGTNAIYTVTSVRTSQPSEEFSYKSVYSTTAQLVNGGQNWRVGDTVTVTMKGKNYTIRVEEETFGFAFESEASASYTTPENTDSGILDVGDIVGALTSDIQALENYDATPIGNVIYIRRTDGNDFNIQTRGGVTDNALTGIKGSVNDITRLPEQCVPGVVLLVRNSADSNADDYYVRFKPSTGDIPGQGSWEETFKPGITTNLNPSTMPHALIREADGDFTFRPLTSAFDDALFWAPREVGDDDTNPEPSFIGKTVKDMFFFMNRLGFLSSDSVVLSQPGDYFNFFVGSAIAVSDADPIDMSASSTRPATLKAALGTPKGLLLFAENSQFLLATSEAAFGPSTVKLTEIATYSYSSDIRPLETGVSVLFSTEADTFSKVYEMAVDSIENRPVVAENTRIIPEYIPPDLTLAASSPNNSIVFFGDGTETLWVFKFFNSEDKRSLAGWGKWKYPSPVKLIRFDHDTGYIVQKNGDDHILCKFEMLDDPKTSPIIAYGQKFAPRLDNYILKEDLVLEPSPDVANYTRIRFPQGAYVEGATPCIILTVSGNSTFFGSPEIQDDLPETLLVKSDDGGYYVEVDDLVAEQDFILGITYEMSIHLPSFYVKDESRADRKDTPMVETVYIDLYYSSRFKAIIKRLGYADREIELPAVDADIYPANAAAIEDVVSKTVPLYCRGDYATIVLHTSDPLPASITSYRWEGHYSNRGIRIV